MKPVFVIIAALIALIIIGWAGLQVKPKPFAPYPAVEDFDPETLPVDDDLPPPVARFYNVVYGPRYGDEIPVITSAVITGRARMRVMGITFPARLRFTHLAGRGYRHYIEATWFGLPILTINERYVDGESLFELPFGVTENDPKVNQGANLGLWAESMWLSSVFLTDSRVEWEAVDETTALVRVPFEESQQTLVVRFDPETNLVRLMTSMRYKGADAPEKTLWINEVREWDEMNGILTMTGAALTWLDEGTPWAIFDIDEIVYNVDVTDYIRAKGP